MHPSSLFIRRKIALVPSSGIDLLSYGISIIAALILFILMVRLAKGNFLNSYPFISQDGFDWLFEGKYLQNVLVGKHLSELPQPYTLRQPIFVAVTMLDALSGNRGLIVMACIAISFCLTSLSIFWTLQALGVSSEIRLWSLFVFMISPLGYFRFWILSDQLAIMLMQFSTLLLVKSKRGSDKRWYFGATIAAILAGWTQVYGIIPYGIGTVVFFFSRRLRYHEWDTQLIYISVTAAVFWAATLLFWYKIFPHDEMLNQVSALKLGFGMFRFYANTWIFSFGPFLLIVVYFLCGSRQIWHFFYQEENVLIAGIVTCFAGFTFIYQVPEARFSYLYLSFVVILMALLLDFCPSATSWQRITMRTVELVSLSLVVLGSLLLVPPNYWQPRVKSLHVDSGASWLAQLIHAQPVDRFGLGPRCSSWVDFCKAADATAAITPLGPYAVRVTSDYRTLMLLDN